MCQPIAIGDLDTCTNPSVWCDVNCFAAYSREMNNANGLLTFSIQGQGNAQGSISQLLRTYTQTYTFTDDKTSSSYNPFQETILELCLDPTIPGGCDSFLQDYCPTVTDNNNINTSLCGCYTDDNPCSATCVLISTVKKSDSKGNLIRCPGNVCVINDVTVNSINNNTNGNVNIINICPGCIEGQCTCIINGDDVNQLVGSVGLTTNVKQYCGPNSVYQQNGVDVDPDTIIGTIPQNKSNPPSYPYYLLLVVAIFIFVIVGSSLLLTYLFKAKI